MFHVQMGRNITLRKSAEIELQNFTQPIVTEVREFYRMLSQLAVGMMYRVVQTYVSFTH